MTARLALALLVAVLLFLSAYPLGTGSPVTLGIAADHTWAGRG